MCRRWEEREGGRGYTQCMPSYITTSPSHPVTHVYYTYMQVYTGIILRVCDDSNYTQLLLKDLIVKHIKKAPQWLHPIARLRTVTFSFYVCMCMLMGSNFWPKCDMRVYGIGQYSRVLCRIPDYMSIGTHCVNDWVYYYCNKSGYIISHLA